MGAASGRRDLESECLRHCGAERRWQDNVRERILAGLRGLQEFHQRRFDRTRSVTIQARSRCLPRRAADLEEIKLAVKHRESFGFETTLAGRSYLSVIRRLKKLGYEVFLWVPTVELALTRVKARVMGGGHDVPETVARRRFDRSIRNFLLLYRSLSDSWTLLDNAGTAPDVIAFEKFASLRIMDREIYDGLIARYGKP
jgi:predicted ABC-type ATPase